MKTRELRIGNLIIENGVVKKFTPHMMIGMHSTEVLSKDDFDDRYNPIPLTEEWLLNIRESYFYNITLVHRFGISPIHDGIYLCQDSEEQGVKVEYVHHLQNAFYYLSGYKELEVKSLIEDKQ